MALFVSWWGMFLKQCFPACQLFWKSQVLVLKIIHWWPPVWSLSWTETDREKQQSQRNPHQDYYNFQALAWLFSGFEWYFNFTWIHQAMLLAFGDLIVDWNGQRVWLWRIQMGAGWRCLCAMLTAIWSTFHALWPCKVLMMMTSLTTFMMSRHHKGQVAFVSR